jgi:hypothetical protein
MYDWVQAFCLLVIALGGTLVWSILNRRRTRYDLAYGWFRVFLRFALGSTMIGYGIARRFRCRWARCPSPGCSSRRQLLADGRALVLDRRIVRMRNSWVSWKRPAACPCSCPARNSRAGGIRGHVRSVHAQHDLRRRSNCFRSTWSRCRWS